ILALGFVTHKSASRVRFRANRTLSRHRRMTGRDPGCVKTHTSAKCRKHNSPAKHRTSRVQYDLTLRDAIARKYFYVWSDRWSLHTAKTPSGHSKHSLALSGLSHRRGDGNVVSFLHCMNDPNLRVTWQATSNDENS